MATPSNTYPLSSQLPPIIQIGKPYSYQIPQDTFTSNLNNITYSTSGLPSWLTFDQESRTFSGSAPSDLLDPYQSQLIWFDLIAKDSDGQSSVNSSLQITNMDVATVCNTFQLQTALSVSGSNSKNGYLASADTLVLSPETDFEFSLNKDNIFNSTAPIVLYQALTEAHTPLPNWLSFNPSTLSFSGTAPTVNSEIAPSVAYRVSVMAVQFSGFSSAEISFEVSVGAHQFITGITAANLSVAPDKDFIYNVPLDKMALDGSPVLAANISNINVDPHPTWLAVNSTLVAVQGTVPQDFSNSSYTVTITNVYNDDVSLNLTLYKIPEQSSNNDTSQETIFTKSSLPAINATTGEFFSYQVPGSSFNTSSSSSSFNVSYDPAAPWISYIATNHSFVGKVPTDFSGTTVTMANKNDSEDSLSLTIRSIDSKSTATTSSHTSSSSTPSSSASSVPSSSSSSSKKKLAIILGVVIPVASLLILALGLYLCCCLRRRRRSSRTADPIDGPLQPDEEGLQHTTLREKASSVLTAGPFSSVEKLSAFSTPTLGGNLKKDAGGGGGEWDSPSRAAELNLYNLDNPTYPYLDPIAATTSLSLTESDITQIGVDRTLPGSSYSLAATTEPLFSVTAPSEAPVTTTKPLTIPPPAAIQSGDYNVPGRARNSWRQTMETGYKWHARSEGGSLATIATDELVSVRMVNERLAGSTAAVIPRDHSSLLIETIDQSDESDYETDHIAPAMPVVKQISETPSDSIGSYSTSDSVPSGAPITYIGSESIAPVKSNIEERRESGIIPFEFASTSPKNTDQPSSIRVVRD